MFAGPAHTQSQRQRTQNDDDYTLTAKTLDVMTPLAAAAHRIEQVWINNELIIQKPVADRWFYSIRRIERCVTVPLSASLSALSSPPKAKAVIDGHCS